MNEIDQLIDSQYEDSIEAYYYHEVETTEDRWNLDPYEEDDIPLDER